MANPANSVLQNLLPVQAYFAVDGTFQTFIGQGVPFYATFNPVQSGLTITNSTIDSSTIGATSPSTGVFTNISTTTGTISTTPSANTDIANKFYVDTVAQGLGPKAACAVGSTVNITTLSGLLTIDGYTVTAGQRVLVKNQTASQDNGIYVASASAWTRATDMDVWSEVPGAYTVLLSGGQANTGWVCTATATGTIGVTAMPWVQFSGTGAYFAGTGLTLASNTFSITNTGVTAASYGSASQSLSATVNAQGQLTSLSAQSIAIGATQITSGTIDTARISGSYTGITGVGTLTAGTWNASTIGVAYGGTGLTSYTIGDLIYASGATTLDKLADIATGNALISGGVGVAPSWGKIGLTTHISGVLPIANGGTNGTATPTAGGIAYGSGTAYAFTAAGTSGQVLTSAGAGTPTWTTIGGGDVFGPSSATDNAIARFDTTTGKLIQNSAITIDDSANLVGARSVQYSGSIPATTPIGTMWFDSSTDTLNFKQNNITQQIGEELFVYGRASADIVDGQVIVVTGAYGTTGIVEFAPAPIGTTNGDSIIGMATEPITKNSFGRITAFGTVHGLDTAALGSGVAVYYDPTVVGGYTTTLPSAPNLKVQIGVVTKAAGGVNGSIAVQVIHPSTISGQSDVQITSIANGNLLQYVSANSRWQNIAASSVTVGTATNLAGGVAGAIPYQSGSGATGFSAAGTTGQVLTSAGTGVPTWTTPTSYATVTDDTTTNAVRYPLFAAATSGNLTTEYVSSTKYQFNPSTGVLTATQFTGSGAGLTSIPNSALTNSSITVGSTAISLGGSATTIAGLTSVTSTTFVGALTGNASTATSATTATNATNTAITDDTSTNAVFYPTFVSNTTGNLPQTVSSTKLKFNPSTGALTANQLIIAP